MLGRVTIINQGILNSGIPIKISLENNALYGIQNKTLIGTHIDYEINKDFIIGGTFLNLTERPYTVKINTGDEPISNTVPAIFPVVCPNTGAIRIRILMIYFIIKKYYLL